MNGINADNLRQILRHRCEAAGSQDAWARENGFTGPFITNVLSGFRKPSTRMALALGYEKKVIYTPCVIETTGA